MTNEQILARVTHTMRLEGQEISLAAQNALLALDLNDLDDEQLAAVLGGYNRNSDGGMPLDPDETTGLIPPLTCQQQLNDFEALNIAWAMLRAMKCPDIRQNLLTVSGMLNLHRYMFDQTWSWAGSMRRRDTNIGVPSGQVATALGALCGDVAYQTAQRTLPWDELAARFHHRLVSIHPFPNGNGRHARLATDLLLHSHDQLMFAWGAQSNLAPAETRRLYLAALREADSGEITALLRFVRA